MPPSRSGKSSNLSGAWDGVYNYPGDAAPVWFSATLAQRGAWITGATEEIGNSEDATNIRITATLQGRRDGARVAWLKLYDRVSRSYDAVAYEGHVNDDATEISGRWMIHGVWSGAFLMIRTPGRGMASIRLAAEPIRRVGRVKGIA